MNEKYGGMVDKRYMFVMPEYDESQIIIHSSKFYVLN